MKALVTGGAGFIGSHLIDLLLEEKFEVICFDNLDDGNLENLSHALKSNSFTFIEDDILNFDRLSEASVGCDVIFHLAGKADIVPSVENPKKYFDVNVTGTVNVLEAARFNSIKRVVYAASSSCYGIATNFPTSETDALSPEYPYAQTKLMGEEALLHWGKIYNIEVNSLRLFNVYGPRSRTNGTYGAVFGVFLAQKLANKPFTVVGDGEQVRDFVFVTDVAKAFLSAATSKCFQEIFNVATGKPQSVNTLISLLDGHGVEFIPKRPGEPDRTHGDSSKIANKLNWHAEVSFADGVAEILKNIDYWKKAKVWSTSEIVDETKSWFKFLGTDCEE
ncbi:NAD-dependent dehydratase [Halobacteriovorax marinus]|uniref:NAD-dependent dehydratase n=1 Tax=Halobacteriovorax marinus TaxID=97084 RepID=A0A1Y5F2H1_9BACT|nr:NAD-dependent dehydratase [Halobacteriovorax marinus]